VSLAIGKLTVRMFRRDNRIDELVPRPHKSIVINVSRLDNFVVLPRQPH
jgi:hypothetical protein